VETTPLSPCPHCGETTAAAARICPRCQRDVRLDLWLAAPLPSSRDAYAAARQLAELAPEAGFLAIKRALDAGAGVVLAGLVRQTADAAVAVLAAHGGGGRLLPHAPQRAPAVAARRPAKVPLAARMAAVVAAVGLLVWLLRPAAAPPPAPPQTGAPTAAGLTLRPLLSPREIGALAAAATVSLRCEGSLGSGFFVAPELVVTNAHVLCGEANPLEVVLADGRRLTGIPGQQDAWLDLALVRVDGAVAATLPLGDASRLEQGDALFFYGNPRGLDFTLAQAMLSHALRPLRGVAYLQIDGNVNPGNSGGPLLNPRGEVVGVVTAMIGEASGLGLALPVNYLYDGERPLLDSQPASDRAGWQRMIGVTAEEEEREAAAARESLERPVLASALLAGGRVMAMVVRAAEWEPAREWLDFSLAADGAVLCTAGGEASRWSRLGSLDDQVMDERTRQWLERHFLERAVWVAAIPLEWSGCAVQGLPPRATVMLEQAAPGQDRVPLQSAGGLFPTR
jgi:serine protease Do